MLNIDISQENMNIHLSIKKSAFISIVGKSGCGKTTLLRMLAGLDTINNGKIEFNNSVWFDSKKNIKKDIQKREIGFVFQQLSLFPHMNVEQNLLYANNNCKKANKLLDFFEIGHLKKKSTLHLSWGEKQRVAIIRSLMKNPKILLLDEIFSALNDDLKEKLFNKIFEIHKQLNLTTLFVTHNKEEIYKYSDEIIEFKENKITKYPNNNKKVLLEAHIQSIYNNIATLKIDDFIFELPVKLLKNLKDNIHGY